MLRLFKYMPMATLLKFMQDPCLRITPSHCQNDPFEFGFSKNDIEALNMLEPGRSIGSHIQAFAQRHGVISLTTEYQDVCMWAHYAEHHKGAVVEILVDKSDPYSAFLFPDFIVQRSISDLHFSNVKYEKVRSLEAVTKKNAEDIRFHYYFTKYERWSSESEYRFIVPFDAVYKIVCTECSAKHLKWITGSNCNFLSEISGSEPKLYEIKGPNLEVLTMDPGRFAILETLWGLSEDTNVMFFLRLASGCPGISSGSIGRIYFGANADLTKFMEDIEDSDCESLYRNYINLSDGCLHSIFQATIEANSYELKFLPVSRRQFGPDSE